MGKAGISGLPRKLDSLIRITIAFAKLKLKSIADMEDAREAMLFFNEGLKYFNQTSELLKTHEISPMRKSERLSKITMVFLCC